MKHTHSSLDMTRTDEPSAGIGRRPRTSNTDAIEPDRDSDVYLMTSPTYYLQYHGAEWNIKPSDTVHLLDQSARNALVSVKRSEDDDTSRLFYLAHHPTEAWHVTEIFSPPSDRQQE